MPELPEVETVRRLLAPHWEGRTLRRVAVRDPLLTGDAPPEVLMRAIAGRQIARVDRRGKYLIARFADGGAMVIHLRMTGMLHPLAPGMDEPPHTRMVYESDDGATVVFTDTRRFGTVDLFASDAELDAYLAGRLGPEPIAAAWSVEDFHAALARRATPIKSALLDQRIGCGMGNIYADEALHRARIDPHRPAHSITRREAELLTAAMRRVLTDAIDMGGSNVRDYAPPGLDPRYQEQHQVYGRGGQPCVTCGAELVRSRIGGRATVHCAVCQPPAGPRP